MPSIPRLVPAALRIALTGAALAFVGCSFSRTVVNGHVRELDSSWIRPGRTTKSEVVARMGRPPSILGVREGMARYYDDYLALWPKGVDMEGEDVDGPEMNAFRWSCYDSFSGSFEGGHWIIPTFAKGGCHRAHDLLILFDRDDVVSLVSRTELVDDRVRILEWREAK